MTNVVDSSNVAVALNGSAATKASGLAFLQVPLEEGYVKEAGTWRLGCSIEKAVCIMHDGGDWDIGSDRWVFARTGRFFFRTDSTRLIGRFVFSPDHSDKPPFPFRWIGSQADHPETISVNDSEPAFLNPKGRSKSDGPLEKDLLNLEMPLA